MLLPLPVPPAVLYRPIHTVTIINVTLPGLLYLGPCIVYQWPFNFLLQEDFLLLFIFTRCSFLFYILPSFMLFRNWGEVLCFPFGINSALVVPAHHALFFL